MPELPDARRQRYTQAFGLSANDAGVLVAEMETAAYFEAVAQGRDAKQAANWVMGDLFGALTSSACRLSARRSPPRRSASSST